MLILLVIADWVMSVAIYEENFNQRFKTYEPYKFYVSDFEGLLRTKYEFKSNKGQKLAGYLYHVGDDQRGIVVMAHGFGGGGHNNYLDCANYFAQHGYYVFAYDATGNDESEGKGVGGVPQGVVDLDYAISFVEESGKFPKLPIVLFGHSWGAYSACAVLSYHPEVKAVIECSGFNKSSDLYESEGKKQVGVGIHLMMPFVKLHEIIKYGDYATASAMKGFRESKASVMVVHSAEDPVVPREYGFLTYWKKYENDPRFTFETVADRLHNDVYYDAYYLQEIESNVEKWRKKLDYDYRADENKERFEKEKAEFIHKHMNRKKLSNMLDVEMFESFVAFYDKNIKK
ncbi:hypothetical protein SAMN02910358_01145 [Lachnospiraceae bacterium XBB1006]|nr:hypothetical protein SAMN02910358_01145 [Lachnospiraceae bacterium XBB1006]